MALRIFLKGQIHEWDKFPESLGKFNEALADHFPITLPQKYSMYYFDQYGYKRKINDEMDFSGFLLLKGTVKPLKLEIEDDFASVNDSSTNNLLESLSKALFKEQPIPAPLYNSTPTQSTLTEEQKNNMMLEEGPKVSNGFGPDKIKVEEDRYQKVMKLQGEDEFTVKLKLREEMRNMLQNDVPFLAELIEEYLGGERDYDLPYQKPPLDTTYLPSNPSKKSKVSTVHKNVRCSVCGVFPIVGVRYRSTLLDDFDMCEDCEESVDHPYPLMKIKQEEQELPKETPKEVKKPASKPKLPDEKNGEKGTKLNMTSLFSNLSLNDVGNIAAKLVKENRKEASNEMVNLLEKFNKFKLKGAHSFEEDKANDDENNRDKDEDGEEKKVNHKKNDNGMHEEEPPLQLSGEAESRVMDKVLKLEEVFPDYKFDLLYEIVRKHVDMGVEELTNKILTHGT